ncbi:MAG: biotin--[acetyl-CoA-carboxylase] ligase [Dehalococcoidia bacterium]|nr:biotin--[acetyl-CoA-carboxylase] ligase [Dehalococcoidia bacterium]
MQFTPLSAGEISDALQPQCIGSCVVYSQVMTSTMDVAQSQIAAGAQHGTIVICEQQGQGQGRLSRQWVSPLGGVYISIILYPPHQIALQLTALAALAVSDAIFQICKLETCFKWPNDVLLGVKKVSGIIARRGQDGHGRTWVVVGIGINANMQMSQQPAEIADVAASLSQAVGREVPRNQLIISLLQSCERRYNALERGEMLWQEWQHKLVTLGKSVVVKSRTDVYEGLAEAINNEGSLLLRKSNGETIAIPAGDVTLRTC